MAKFRSYFVSDLDSLKSSISDLLAFNSESAVDESCYQKFVDCFEVISNCVNNRNYSDLIRKK